MGGAVRIAVEKKIPSKSSNHVLVFSHQIDILINAFTPSLSKLTLSKQNFYKFFMIISGESTQEAQCFIYIFKTPFCAFSETGS